MRHWDQKEHPIARFANYLGQKGYWDAEKEKAWKDSSRKEVCTSIILSFIKIRVVVFTFFNVLQSVLVSKRLESEYSSF